MAAFQTYEARNIRQGYRAWRGEHNGEVLAILPDPPPGTVSLHVQCSVCGAAEQWIGIPAHSAVHAQAVQR